MPIDYVADFADMALQTLLSLEPRALGLNPRFLTKRRKRIAVTSFFVFVIFVFVYYMTSSVYSHDESSRASKNLNISYQESDPKHKTHNLKVPSDGFAGCLLLKDDNDRLSEWIAYHWLVLPLKYLVVAIDPTGTTSPEKILNLWKEADLGLEISLWNDVDYGHWINEKLDDLHKHRDRQKRFLYECQRFHKKNNRSWVAVIDPDEYITYNLIQDDERDPEFLKDIDTIDISDLNPDFTDMEYHKKMITLRRGLDVHFDRTTVFDYIKMNPEPFDNEPCYLMPRLFFSAVESSAEIVQKSEVDEFGIDPMKFSTLRYFKHAEKGAHWANYFSKVMIDLSRTDDSEFTMQMENIHQPLKSACHYPVKLYDTGILRVQHYIGSWKQYSSRVDVRRSRKKYDETAWENNGIDFQLQGWLRRFLLTVGEEKGKHLLQYAGKIESGKTKIIDGPEFVHVPEGKYGPYKYDDE